MRFLEGTDILVAEMPKSVFADMQQASEIAIEQKIISIEVGVYGYILNIEKEEYLKCYSI